MRSHSPREVADAIIATSFSPGKGAEQVEGPTLSFMVAVGPESAARPIRSLCAKSTKRKCIVFIIVPTMN